MLLSEPNRKLRLTDFYEDILRPQARVSEGNNTFMLIFFYKISYSNNLEKSYFNLS